MIEDINLFGDTIEFNPIQSEYMSAIFNDDLQLNNNHYKEYVFFGGYRAGKSFVQQLSVYLICSLYPNIRCLYMRNTYDELKDSVIAQFNESFLKYGNYEYIQSSKDGSHIAKFNNGSEIRFRSADMPTKLLSNEYDLIALCQAEHIPEDVFSILIGRWSGTRLPKKLLLLEGNPAATWVKRQYKDADINKLHENGVYFKEIQTHENAHNLDVDYIKDFKSRNSERDYRRFILGEWESVDEMVFSEFKEANHVIEPLAFSKDEYKHFKIAMGGDYGYRNPAAFLWGYKDYDGQTIIFDEWYKNEQQPIDIREAGLKYGRFPIYYDFSIKRPDRDGRSLWDELVAPGKDNFGRSMQGLLLIPSNKDEMRNIVEVNSMFKQNNLLITRNCANLINELKSYKWQINRIGTNKNNPERPVDKDNHAIDSLLYLTNGMRIKKSIHPDIIANKKSLKAITERPQQRSVEDYG